MGSGKNIALIILASFLLSLLGYVFYYRFWQKGGGTAAHLNVQSLYDDRLSVSLNNEKIGTTPLELFRSSPGEKTLSLGNGRNTYQTKISLSSGTLTVVNWGLGPTSTFSEGEVLWFEKGQRRGTAPLLVISDPEGAEVRLDDVLLGNTPLVNSDLSAGEHTLKISQENYKERVISLNLQEGYKLNVKVKLFLLPFLSKTATKIESPGDPRFVLAGFYADNPLLTADPSGWVKGLTFYWNLGREATESGLPYDYLLDAGGQLYDTAGVKLAAASEVEKKLEKARIAYLGRTGEALAEAAQKTLADFAGKVFLTVRKVEVSGTPQGWLRVREKPSTEAKELGRVNERERLELLSETAGWYQIRTAAGLVGYISAAYARKL
jgi:hypothetical protein